MRTELRREGKEVCCWSTLKTRGTRPPKRREKNTQAGTQRRSDTEIYNLRVTLQPPTLQVLLTSQRAVLRCCCLARCLGSILPCNKSGRRKKRERRKKKSWEKGDLIVVRERPGQPACLFERSWTVKEIWPSWAICSEDLRYCEVQIAESCVVSGRTRTISAGVKWTGRKPHRDWSVRRDQTDQTLTGAIQGSW